MEVKNYFAFTKEQKIIPFCDVYLYLAGTETLATGVKDKDGNDIDNPFKADGNGLVQFTGPTGSYDLRFKSLLRDYRIRISIIDFDEVVGAVSGALKTVATLAELQALTGMAADTPREVIETTTGSSDGFSVVFRTGDKSSEVAAYPSLWVAPAEPGDGSTGAWQRNSVEVALDDLLENTSRYTKNPIIEVTAATATASNNEWYPLRPVVYGNYLISLVMGEYGVSTDRSCLDIHRREPDGSISLVSSTVVGGIGQQCRGLAVYGNYVYLGTFQDYEIIILDLSDLSSPTVVSTFATGYAGGIQAINIVAGTLYVSHWGGPALSTYTLADPELPIYIGSQEVAGAGNFSQPLSDGRGNLWVIAWAEVGDTNLVCFDISDPSINPPILSNTEIIGMSKCRYGQIYRGRLFVGLFDAVAATGTFEINIDDPTAPTLYETHDSEAREPLIYNGAIYGSANNVVTDFSAYSFGDIFADREIVLGYGCDFPTLAFGGIVCYKRNQLLQPKLTYIQFKAESKDDTAKDFGLFDDLSSRVSKTHRLDASVANLGEATAQSMVIDTLDAGTATATSLNGLLIEQIGASSMTLGTAATGPSITGVNNVAIAKDALGVVTTGANNVAVGSSALKLITTQDSCTAVGTSALANNTAFNNASGFGFNSQVTGSNQVQLGNSATTTYAYGAVQDRSDARDKDDIAPLSDAHISFFMDIEWKQYRLDYREDYNWGESDGSKKRTRLHVGAIAQQVEAAMIKHGVDFAGLQHHSLSGGMDVYTLGYQEFIAIQGEIIQRQQKKIDSIESRLDIAGI